MNGRAINTTSNIWKFSFKKYKLEQHNHIANDTKYSELQENIAIGLITDAMIVELQKRIEAVCDTANDNEWERESSKWWSLPHMKFKLKQLNLLQGNIVEIPAADISSKCNEELPDFTNLTENKTKGLI